MGAEELARHLADCRGVVAAVVQDGDATPLVQLMLDDGWTFDGEETVEGKRVRYLVPPPELAARLAPTSLLYELNAGPEYAHRDGCIWPHKICTGHAPLPAQRLDCGGCSFATADPNRMDGHLNATGHGVPSQPTYGVLDNGCPQHGYRVADGCPECAVRVHRIALTTSPEEDPA